MGLDIHTIEVPPGAFSLAQPDRVTLGILPQVANVVGSGAGATVSTVITGLTLPATYTVHIDPRQDCTAWTSSHTAAGFTVNLNPRLASNTVAAGAFDCIVFA